MADPKPLPDFKSKTASDQARLGEDGARLLLERGRAWDLAPLVRAGGAILFPHATITTCGHQIAAAVSACLVSGAPRVVALGVIHALNDELRSSRARVAAGSDPESETTRGIQGPDLCGREDWRQEFSLDHFRFLWNIASADHRGPAPELVLRYPFLAGGRPRTLLGMDELEALVEDAVVVATADPFHHGRGYGDPPPSAFAPDAGGLELARETIGTGLGILESGDYPAFERHCAEARSDARDTGQVLRYLRGPLRGRILDLVADDMTGPYAAPPPTWVAGALVALEPI